LQARPHPGAGIRTLTAARRPPYFPARMSTLMLKRTATTKKPSAGLLRLRMR